MGDGHSDAAAAAQLALLAVGGAGGPRPVAEAVAEAQARPRVHKAQAPVLAPRLQRQQQLQVRLRPLALRHPRLRCLLRQRPCPRPHRLGPLGGLGQGVLAGGADEAQRALAPEGPARQRHALAPVLAAGAAAGGGGGRDLARLALDTGSY